MTSSRTVPKKVADWLGAYQAVRDELTPDGFRAIVEMSTAADVASINVGMAAARIVFANDRAAATVAALLTQSGIKPTSLNYGDELE